MSFLRRLVESQYKGGRIGIGLVFFLLPTLLWLGFQFAFGFAINVQGTALSLGLGLLTWIVVCAVLLVLLKVFKGKEAHARFSSVLAAFSVNYLAAAIAGLLVLALTYITIPGFFEKLSSLQGTDLTTEQMVAVVESLALPSDTMLLVVFALMGLISLLAAFAGVYVIYRIGQLGRETSRFSNLVFTVVALGIILGTNLALGAIIGYFL